MVKTILIFHANQPAVADVQAALVGQSEIYATDQLKMVREFLKQKHVDALIIFLPAVAHLTIKLRCLKLLRYVRRKRYDNLLKILVCADQDEHPVRHYLAYGVTAIVADPLALPRLLKQDARPARL